MTCGTPILLFTVFSFLSGCAPSVKTNSSPANIDELINATEVKRIEETLSSDDMQGRATMSPGIDKAADFIAREFKKAGIQPLKGDSYFQEFSMPERAQASVNAEAGGVQKPLKNVVGMLPGKSRKDEYVIFSGHYDHLGIKHDHQNGEDSIYNGANDDAAGSTAVIILAKYFAAQNNNERTLIFSTFTAEEIGGFGSQYFSSQFDPSKVMAMFNIEMIGTDSKWGNNSAYITGYEKTDMGKILEKNLKGSGFKFYPDPYPAQQLFYRSDNATLARYGVPAHTISTSKMDNEKYYHTVGDEINTLDMKNMAEIIKAIAISSRSIIAGTDTPSRVDVSGLK